MNIQEIQVAVQKIADDSVGDGAAHEWQDDLYLAFIEYVAEHGEENIREMAREILKVRDMDFTRWYG